MFKDEYQKTFSQVTASEETLRRVLNLQKPVKTRTFRGTIGKVLMAAAILSTLVMTVSAAELGWFRGYFEGAGEPLTQSEIDYIEANEQPLGQSQTKGGYTLRVKSAMTDGRRAYIIIGVTGPEGVVLDNTGTNYNFRGPHISVGNWGDGVFTRADGTELIANMDLMPEDDRDGKNNTLTWVLTLSPDLDEEGDLPFYPNSVWNLSFRNLTASFFDDEYLRTLEEKYGDQVTDLATEEELARWHPEVTLAEGEWNFEIVFGESSNKAVELIDNPVTTLAFIRKNNDAEGKMDEETTPVNITSFVLRNLSATVTADIDFVLSLESIDCTKAVYAVMKDGSRTWLYARSSSRGECQLEPERPIVLEEVAYILLADGTEIPMP